MDKNNNGIADKVEAYSLLFISIILVLAGVSGAGLQLLTEGFSKFLIIAGMSGLLGDEFIKGVLLKRLK